MPQTRFVLKKALELGHRVVVVVNKVDRPAARVQHVINSTFELFCELNATDEQVGEGRGVTEWKRGEGCCVGMCCRAESEGRSRGSVGERRAVGGGGWVTNGTAGQQLHLICINIAFNTLCC